MDEEHSRWTGFEILLCLIFSWTDIPLQTEETKREILTIVETIPLEEQEVLCLHLGLRDGKSRTLEEVAESMNLSGNFVVTFLKVGLSRLRHPERSDRLGKFLRSS